MVKNNESIDRVFDKLMDLSKENKIKAESTSKYGMSRFFEGESYAFEYSAAILVGADCSIAGDREEISRDIRELIPIVKPTSITGYSLFILQKKDDNPHMPIVSIQLPTNIANYLCRLIQNDKASRKPSSPTGEV